MGFTIPHTIQAGQPMRAAPIQENFESIQGFLNGGIDADALGDKCVESRHLGDMAVATGNLKNNAITVGKLEKGLSFHYRPPEMANAAYKATDIWFRSTDNPSTPMWTVGPYDIKTRLHITGCASLQQIGDTSKSSMLSAAILDQADVIKVQGQVRAQMVQADQGSYLNSVPLCGYIDIEPNTTYKFWFGIKSDEDGRIECRAEGTRTTLSGILLPRN